MQVEDINAQSNASGASQTGTFHNFFFSITRNIFCMLFGDPLTTRHGYAIHTPAAASFGDCVSYYKRTIVHSTLVLVHYVIHTAARVRNLTLGLSTTVAMNKKFNFYVYIL